MMFTWLIHDLCAFLSATGLKFESMLYATVLNKPINKVMKLRGNTKWIADFFLHFCHSLLTQPIS